MFGNWTTTPGGRGPFCNDTCGSHRYYVEMRSCAPAHPNLPQGKSCENLDGSLTLRINTTKACEPFKPCKGDLLKKHIYINVSKGTGANGRIGPSALPIVAWADPTESKPDKEVFDELFSWIRMITIRTYKSSLAANAVHQVTDIGHF